MLKKKKTLLIVCAVLMLAAVGGVAVLMSRNSVTPVFNGTRVSGNSGYMLDFTVLDREDTHEIALEPGDVLTCRWSITKGEVDILIRCGDDELYRGNKADTADFELTANDGGSCTISVTGRKAAGRVEINKKENK